MIITAARETTNTAAVEGRNFLGTVASTTMSHKTNTTVRERPTHTLRRHITKMTTLTYKNKVTRLEALANTTVAVVGDKVSSIDHHRRPISMTMMAKIDITSDSM